MQDTTQYLTWCGYSIECLSFAIGRQQRGTGELSIDSYFGCSRILVPKAEGVESVELAASGTSGVGSSVIIGIQYLLLSPRAGLLDLCSDLVALLCSLNAALTAVYLRSGYSSFSLFFFFPQS